MHLVNIESCKHASCEHRSADVGWPSRNGVEVGGPSVNGVDVSGVQIYAIVCSPNEESSMVEQSLAYLFLK